MQQHFAVAVDQITMESEMCGSRFLLNSTICWPGLFAVLLAGCGGAGVPLTDVSGVVTLDGKPLPKATIQFMRVDENGQGISRPSVATTDSSGRYKMQYSTQHHGVPPGTYRVTISTFKSESLDNQERVIPREPELVPEVYNTKSELRADVSKRTTMDFDLKSDAGPIVQPDGRK
ncbi:carboxypeptidase-like regulatory domain-containing protein [Planctomicrobium sp. SH664]|uniref:carboxypeptidase-like regulatory domain-containing protein n=1 Tax=Planctomicrobium sp. SH664 TaxID=3448125 RepID=UPI003F5C3E20